MNEIKIGDTVRYIGDFSEELQGETGVVKHVMGAGTDYAFAHVNFSGELISCAFSSLAQIEARDAEPAVPTDAAANTGDEAVAEVATLQARVATLEAALEEIAALKPDSEPMPDEDYDFDVLTDNHEMTIASANFTYGSDAAYWRAANIAAAALKGEA